MACFDCNVIGIMTSDLLAHAINDDDDFDDVVVVMGSFQGVGKPLEKFKWHIHDRMILLLLVLVL